MEAGWARAVTRGREGRKRGRSWALPGDARDASTPVCQLLGPISCWSVPLSFLVLHTQGPEAKGLLLTELVALATLGRMQIVSLVTPGKAACRDGGKGTGQWSGLVAQAEPGGLLGLQAHGGGSGLWDSRGCLLVIPQQARVQRP